MLAASTSASIHATPQVRGALRHACTFAASMALSLLAVDSAEAQWVVSAAGDGDFTNLQEAIDHASPGEVLYVMPGSYGTAVLAKSLSILGAATGAKPLITSLHVQGAPSFQLQDLRFGSLRAASVPGRSIVDRCEIQSAIYCNPSGWVGGAAFSETGVSSFVVIDAADLLVQNSEFRGCEYQFNWPTTALSVAGSSRVQVVNSLLQGGHASVRPPGPGGSCIPYSSKFGGNGLRVGGTAEVWLAASSAIGGGGFTSCSPTQPPGKKGNGIAVWNSAMVHLRGNSSHVASGDKAISVGGSGQVIWSGVSFTGDASAAQPDPDIVPFLRTAGGQLPGQTVTLLFYGEAGAPALLLVGLEPAQLDVPGLLGAPLWLAPGSLLTILSTQLTGLNDPVRFPFLLPPIPQLAGLAVYAQGVQPKPNGDWLATNLSATLLTY